MTDPAATPPAADPAAQTPAAPWYGADAPADVAEFATKGGFDSPAKALTALRDAQAAAGQALTIPKDANDAAAWDALYAKLGRPDKADGYELQVPQGDNGEFAKALAPVLHKAGVSKAQATQLAASFNEIVAARVQALDAAHAAESEKQGVELKAEWGGKHDANVDLAKRAAAHLGVKADKVAALEQVLGYAETMKFFAGIGQKLGEDTFVSGAGPGAGQGAVPNGANLAKRLFPSMN